MWFIGVEVEQETSAPLPKKNPGSAPAACEGLPCNSDRDAVRKIRIKPLRENNVWVAQG